MPKAAIFDLDGTLLDSVDLHAIAWQEALEKFGHDVSFEQTRGQIGKGGDKLIPVFLSADEQRDHGKKMEEWRSIRFKTAYLPLVRPFSAVPDLLRRVRDAGVRVAVASSAKKDELDKYLDIARIADLVELTDSASCTAPNAVAVAPDTKRSAHCFSCCAPAPHAFPGWRWSRPILFGRSLASPRAHRRFIGRLIAPSGPTVTTIDPAATFPICRSATDATPEEA
jgi:hypothetical protein